MIEGFACYLDPEKISGTVETLQSIDNCLENKNIQESFYELEEYLNKLNFEHGNFETNYKDRLEEIESELGKIKKEIYELGIGVEKTSKVLSNTKEVLAKDIQELSSIYGKRIGENISPMNPVKVIPMTKQERNNIAEVIQSGMNREGSTNNQEINTLPIGLGIGAAGIVGALGAVALDAISPKDKGELEDYHPTEEYQEQEVYQDKRELETDNFEDPSPYYAVHNQEMMNKYYNDNPSNEEKY